MFALPVREHDVQQCCALDAGGKLAYEPRLVDGVCTLEVTRQPLHARRLHAALGPGRDVRPAGVRAAASSASSAAVTTPPRAAACCCRRLELCRHRRVGVSSIAEARLPRTLLGVAHDVGESTVGSRGAGTGRGAS